MNDVARQIADLLQEAGEVHHRVFADTEGADDDWASFYSDWLLAHTQLSRLLGRAPVRSHLTRDLVTLDERYAAEGGGRSWPEWYAQQLIEKYAASASART